MLRFMVTLFNICFVRLARLTASDSMHLVTNFYCQPYKRTGEMCCLRARTNLVTWVGIVYDLTVHGENVVYLAKPDAGFSQLIRLVLWNK